MSGSRIESLPIDLIIADPTVQPREALDPEVVDDYRAAYEADEDLPVALVYREGQNHWLSCGFHRYAGAKAANKASFAAVVREGTKWEATLAAMNDPVHGNRKNGKRFTKRDKRKMVNTLLDNSEWAQKSLRQIADQAGVAVSFVKAVKDERAKASSESERLPQPPTQKGDTQVFLKNTSIPPTNEAAPEPDDSEPDDDVADIDPETVIGRDGKTYPARKTTKAKKTRKSRKSSKGLTAGPSDGTFDAKQQIKLWADTIGRWLRDLPSIDSYREKWPSKEGDRTVKAATELFESLKQWVKVIK